MRACICYVLCFVFPYLLKHHEIPHLVVTKYSQTLKLIYNTRMSEDLRFIFVCFCCCCVGVCTHNTTLSHMHIIVYNKKVLHLNTQKEVIKPANDLASCVDTVGLLKQYLTRVRNVILIYISALQNSTLITQFQG